MTNTATATANLNKFEKFKAEKDGLMGTKVRKNGKNAHLGSCVIKGIPCEDLKPILQDLLNQHFGAQVKEKVLACV